jgi:hypothetical protein
MIGMFSYLENHSHNEDSDVARLGAEAEPIDVRAEVAETPDPPEIRVAQVGSGTPVGGRPGRPFHAGPGRAGGRV